MNIIYKICFIIILIISFHRIIFFELSVKNLILKHRIIVSLSTSKENIKSFSLDRCIKSLLNQSIVPYKIILSINEIDMSYMSDYLNLLINNNIIKVVFVKEDFKYFNRYYYIPDRYKKYIIIVFDDIIFVEKNTIENLFNSYLIYPNAVSANRAYKMKFNEKWILKPFKYWTEANYSDKKPKFYLFAIHGEGALFPPNTLNISDDFIFYFKKAIKAHDFLIKYYELNKNLKTVYVNNSNIYSKFNVHIYEKYNKLLLISPDDAQLANDFGKEYNFNLYNNIRKDKVIISNETKEYFLHKIKNKNITKDTLLVSMTSYPPRIYGISEVFFSLLNQNVDTNSYQCFLTLAKEEFINSEKDLPLDIQRLILNGWIKIIWYHNIYSYKKLIPILERYPENDILIVDDDVIRTNNFIQIFQNDHKLYPSDIICGTFEFSFDNKLEIRRLNGYRGVNCGEMNPVPNIIFQTTRQANGFGGVLYPKHTFKDKRFFNQTLYMNLSPKSDESWQYLFNIMENKILRQTSIIFDNSVNFVNNSQKIETSLFKINFKNYSFINKNLIKYFPEYKSNSLKRQKKIIVSLTSSKYRFKNLNLVLDSIFNNTMKPSKIVLTIYRKDFFF